jgi:hypothetical protein
MEGVTFMQSESDLLHCRGNILGSCLFLLAFIVLVVFGRTSTYGWIMAPFVLPGFHLMVCWVVSTA